MNSASLKVVDVETGVERGGVMAEVVVAVVVVVVGAFGVVVVIIVTLAVK